MAVDFDLLWNRARVAAMSDETESVRIMADILSSKEGRRFIASLELPEAEFCIEILDYGLTEHNLSTPQKQAFFATLRRLAGRHGLLPESIIITDEPDFVDGHRSFVANGSAGVEPGWYEDRAVIVKVTRVAVSGDFEKIKKQFCKDIILRNAFSHPNILKLVGVLVGMEQGRFATLSEWTARGNIMDYVSKNSANRLELLHGAAQGLRYLHNADIIHGAINGTSIRITDDTPPKACLTELRLTTRAFNPLSSQAPLDWSQMVFMAPELLAPSKFGLTSVVPTKEADIYAFGMVILQVLTGEPLRSSEFMEFVRAALYGTPPSKPTNAESIGISDSLWTLIRECLDDHRRRRPQIQKVEARVGNAATNWHTDMPPGCARCETTDDLDELDELECAGIFETYQAEDTQFPYPITNMLPPPRPCRIPPLSCYTPPPSPCLRPPPRRRFRRFLTRLRAIFRSKLKR